MAYSFGWWRIEGELTLPEMPIGGRASRAVLDRFRISNDPVGSFVTIRCRYRPMARPPRMICEKPSLNTANGTNCHLVVVIGS